MHKCICDDCGLVQDGNVGDRCVWSGPHPENGRHTGYLISVDSLIMSWDSDIDKLTKFREQAASGVDWGDGSESVSSA